MVAVVLGVVFPAFGVTLLLVLGVEALLALRGRTRTVEKATADGDGDEVPVGALQ